MLTTNEIGEKIAIARKLKNLSQSQLSDQLAVSAQAVGKWERGESMPDIITFQRIAEILGTDLNYFAGENTILSATESVLSSAAATTDNTEVQKPGWNMSGGNWIDLDFSGLQGLAEKFSGANIDKCRFIESEMSGLALKGNNIKNSDFSRSILSGCKFAGANIERNIFAGCDLSLSEFSRCNVIDCDFSKANLTGTATRWCNFKKVKFDGANLHRTKFTLGQFTEMIFTGDLIECSFENCDFSRVTFENAVLRQCFFKNAKLKRAKFVNCRADRLTYAFMKNCKADMTDITIIET